MGVKAHRRRYKGFVPAAGLGTRLAPITDKIPKPLLPFFGPAVLDLALYKLTSAGLAVSDIAVNTHHLAEKIKHHIENHPCFSVVLLSVEQTILGTGGGLNALHDWIGDDDLIIYNGDIISNIDLAELIDFHETRSSLATLAVLPTALPGKNPLFCHNEKLLGIGERPSDKDITEHTFTGVHILSNTFLKKNIPL